MWGLRAARVFDGEVLHSGHPLVLVDGTRIAGLDLSGARPSADLDVVDLGDVTIMPGLIDSHVHLAFDSAADSVIDQIQAADDEELLRLMGENARRALRAGITTVRDLGDRNGLALRLRETSPGPEILAAGAPLTRRGGHCWFLGGEADDVAELRKAVADRVASGADVIKVMATGGTMTPGFRPDESQYDLAALRAVVEAAHEAGLPVTAHAHGAGGIAHAVRAAVDGIEHAFFIKGREFAPDWTVVAAMAESGVVVSTTSARLPAEYSPIHLTVRENFARMRREGVRLVCSSDAGVGRFKPHDCLPHGVIEFAALIGHTNTEALQAATTAAAEFCRVADRKGRIATGFDADLLAVGGDPVRDLRALLDVRAVYRAGVSTPTRTDPGAR
ncbi:amidohydrolase family protein [Lentzea tibetensis]|uniref:Amidohydrolase family protein n=1 Tax=Lentzea tibetensis TaxID=2591470 RepID=A0A563EEQ6_9PSEU|nr:amidohydrolase family protein [Lentzea tibetensis]TWP43384.1 amidohydrolase family protein [Lentzea tibetensis]